MCPFKFARTTRPERPTRLAVGLGLESALIRLGGHAPANLRPICWRTPAVWFPRFPAAQDRKLGYTAANITIGPASPQAAPSKRC
jgi:hypothetical protein